MQGGPVKAGLLLLRLHSCRKSCYCVVMVLLCITCVVMVCVILESGWIKISKKKLLSRLKPQEVRPANKNLLQIFASIVFPFLVEEWTECDFFFLSPRQTSDPTQTVFEKGWYLPLNLSPSPKNKEGCRCVYCAHNRTEMISPLTNVDQSCCHQALFY